MQNQKHLPEFFRGSGRFRAPTRAFLVALLLGIYVELCASRCAAAPQNILLIIADDYGVDSSSLYNSTNTVVGTPP